MPQRYKHLYRREICTLKDAYKDIAYWQHSPDEIDIERVKNWIKKQIPYKINFDNVNWNEIIIQILI